MPAVGLRLFDQSVKIFRIEVRKCIPVLLHIQQDGTAGQT